MELSNILMIFSIVVSIVIAGILGKQSKRISSLGEQTGVQIKKDVFELLQALDVLEYKIAVKERVCEDISWEYELHCINRFLCSPSSKFVAKRLDDTKGENYGYKLLSDLLNVLSKSEKRDYVTSATERLLSLEKLDFEKMDSDASNLNEDFYEVFKSRTTFNIEARVLGKDGSEQRKIEYGQFNECQFFSVSSDMQVRFAKGNLEYDSINGYSFAAHQYDYGGHFGWGTGRNPVDTSSDYHDYPLFDDWGSHIVDRRKWRTLTLDEWRYLIGHRQNASKKWGLATVCGVYGLVLLPDIWNLDITFYAGSDNWDTNVYDEPIWTTMEAAGAVFLPANGYRYGTEIFESEAPNYLNYWSSTPEDEEFHAYGLKTKWKDENYNNGMGFTEKNRYIIIVEGTNRFFGFSVRLVYDI